MEKNYRQIVVILCGLLLIVSYLAINEYSFNKPGLNDPFHSIGVQSTADLYLTTGNSRKNNPLKTTVGSVFKQKNDSCLEVRDNNPALKNSLRQVVSSRVIDLFFSFYQISRTCVDGASLDRYFGTPIII